MTTRRDFVFGTAALTASACHPQEPPPAGPVSPAPSAPQARAPRENSGMPKRRLGKTGVEVSALGLGGFHMGAAGSEEDGVRLVRAAIDEGITFL
ncbi:MAG TPA: hypothetical protein VGK73_16850, partial [Polyangiaceae bacterium]